MSASSGEKKRYWFPAKRYGWGWGFPTTWQGWVTILLYVGGVSLAALVFPPSRRKDPFIVSSVVMLSSHHLRRTNLRQRFCSCYDVQHFIGNCLLPGFVILELQQSHQFLGVIRGIAHGDHPRRVFAGCRR